MIFNERVWTGHVISWIKELISNSETIFQDATNDTGIKIENGTTKFPDILLFTNKISGIVFNGWELKFPDTPVDDPVLLGNALEKAKQLKSSSFVTWNGQSAIIWKIIDQDYSTKSIQRIKEYSSEREISTRIALSDPVNYQRYEPRLKKRLKEIIYDLEALYQKGEIKEAINISSEISSAIKNCGNMLIPKFTDNISQRKNIDDTFRKKFKEWMILEGATLEILRSSSRRVEIVEPENILSRFMFYKLIGKIVFYQSLSCSTKLNLAPITTNEPNNLQSILCNFFDNAKQIDYQAIFEPDFTDVITYDSVIENVLYEFLKTINNYDFRILPNEVVGNILQQLVPNEERQKFGQYFTPDLLATIVAFPAIKNQDSIVFDPTSGTGTFLSICYDILKYYGKNLHSELLGQIWGNDISHFPALLSVITLYKQCIGDVCNFPRVLRKDFFNLCPEEEVQFPDNKDINIRNSIPIPKFDAIVSNFPFIQQEDIPNELLSEKFYREFGNSQEAFLVDSLFKIDMRSDYYVYCFYQSMKFLKDNGILSIITSNAWLGKNYGMQFKKFILDNFTIKYVVKSTAEHWFTDSKISTIYVVLEMGNSTRPVKFVTIKKKLKDLFCDDDTKLLNYVEDFYNQIDYCDNPSNSSWEKDKSYENVYIKKDDTLRVSVISNNTLQNSIINKENWLKYFISENPLSLFESKLINPYGTIYHSGRGTRTGQDKMFILSRTKISEYGIEENFLLPIVKSSKELSTIHHVLENENYLFLCNKPLTELEENYPNAHRWIKIWEKRTNKKGELLPNVLKNNHPFWYSVNCEDPANIFISINPEKRVFFSYSDEPLIINQRLTAIRVDASDTELIAALLNSITTLLTVELNGVSRHLGALDLNADFFATKIKMLNPDLLNEGQKKKIVQKFRKINNREIGSHNIEFFLTDRRDFDQEVFRSFGFDPAMVSQLYKLLVGLIETRVDLKNR